jgi:Fungal specific transcription factor domain
MPYMELEDPWNIFDSTPIDLSIFNTQDYAPEEAGKTELLLGLYYKSFHGAHPFLLPHNKFTSRRAQQPESVKLLELVMCWIGSLYAPHISSDWHETQIRIKLNNTQSQPPTAFRVQALLLYSIALYSNDQIERSGAILDSAICTALKLGMHRLDFAVNFGERDAVLEESWSRTWWEIYITDLHVAASLHLTTWRTSGLNITVELPCEEYEYESGAIPTPRTLDEYDNREFVVDRDDDVTTGFSSFAQLIGLCRCFDLSLAEGLRTDEDALGRIVREVDATVAAWYMHLPKTKKELVQEDGKADELLFMANMLMQTYVVDVHRPFSALAYSAIESCSRCSPPAPHQGLSPARAQKSQLHTMKILHAIEEFTDLLTLPINITHHTPFVICMIAVTTIAHLSACRYVLNGRDLKVARARVRTAMGALKAYESIWLLGKRTYREVGILAREILGLNEAGVLMPLPERAANDVGHGSFLYDEPNAARDTLDLATMLEDPQFDLHKDIWT